MMALSKSAVAAMENPVTPLALELAEAKKQLRADLKKGAALVGRVSVDRSGKERRRKSRSIVEVVQDQHGKS